MHKGGTDVCVAVRGTGSIGTRHLDILQGMDGVSPVAVPKRSQRAIELAEQGYATAGNMCEAKGHGAQFCVIATATGSHLSDGLEAIELGLDILMEKPLAVNAVDAIRLNHSAKKSALGLYVGCVLRFSESLNTFRSSIAQVGNLHSVRIEAQSFLPDWQPSRDYRDTFRAREVEGGVLLDMIHEIDYAGWIFGWPAALQANLGNLGRLGIAAEEFAELSWETPFGCLVSIRIDCISKPTRRQMRAFGERGTIVWDDTCGTVSVLLGDDPAFEVTSAQTRHEMLGAQTRAFLDATPTGHDPRLASGDEGVKALAICDAARRSAESRKEEQVNYQ